MSRPHQQPVTPAVGGIPVGLPLREPGLAPQAAPQAAAPQVQVQAPAPPAPLPAAPQDYPAAPQGYPAASGGLPAPMPPVPPASPQGQGNPVTAALSTVGRWIEEHPKTSAVIAAALGAAAAGASRNVTPPWSKPGT